MDARKTTRPLFCAAVIALALVAGCTTTKATVRTSSGTEIAVSEIPADWLQGCDRLGEGAPKNEVGELVLDYTELAEAYAASCKRYKQLSDYLKEVVKKERGKPANP